MKTSRPRSRISLGAVALAVFSLAACTAGEADPSPGTYTVRFPSTQAAVATDTVQLLVFDAPEDEDERAAFCSDLITARRRRDQLEPVVQNPPVNICEMLFGRKPVTVPYGDKAVLAIAQRGGADFMIGCTTQTVGEGDLPLPIVMTLVSLGRPVPPTECVSVGDFCAERCQ
jgi:hypothetical protein